MQATYPFDLAFLCPPSHSCLSLLGRGSREEESSKQRFVESSFEYASSFLYHYNMRLLNTLQSIPAVLLRRSLGRIRLKNRSTINSDTLVPPSHSRRTFQLAVTALSASL